MKLYSFSFVLVLSLYGENVLSKKHGRRVSKAHDGGKIVGGYNTTIQNVPYQVYLLLKEGNAYYQCGGSIINNRYVLTAAHCLQGVSLAYIRVGSTNSDSGGTVYKSEGITAHPQYNKQNSDYDVGIIKVSRDMQLDGRNVKAVKLPSAGTKVNPGIELFVTGWGATSENGQVSSTLMAVKVPAVSKDECRRSYGSSITDRMICAGFPQGGKDSCQGDSGGPAVSDGTQLGIVSFGAGCARANYPGAYTNVASVRTWIRSETGV